MNVHRFSRFYSTRRDGSLEYHYDVAWWRITGAIVWEAKVYRVGELKGTPGGQFENPTQFPQRDVRAVVEDSIEVLIGVAK